MTNATQDLLGSTPIHRLLIRQASPQILSNIVVSFYSTIDLLFIGSLGPTAIAAAGIVTNFTYSFFIAVTLITSTGGTPLISRLLGAGNVHDAETTLSAMFTISILISLLTPMIFLFPPLCRALLALFDADESPELMATAQMYLIPHAAGQITFFLYSLLTTLSALGRPVLAMGLEIASCVVKVALDAPLIRLFGIAGAGYSTLAGNSFSGIVALLFFTTPWFKSPIRVRWGRVFRVPHWSVLLTVCKLGFGSFLSELLYGLVMIFFNTALSSASNTEEEFVSLLALSSIIGRVFAWAWQPLLAVGNSVSAILAYNLAVLSKASSGTPLPRFWPPDESPSFSDLLRPVKSAVSFVSAIFSKREASKQPLLPSFLPSDVSEFSPLGSRSRASSVASELSTHHIASALSATSSFTHASLPPIAEPAPAAIYPSQKLPAFPFSNTGTSSAVLTTAAVSACSGGHPSSSPSRSSSDNDRERDRGGTGALHSASPVLSLPPLPPGTPDRIPQSAHSTSVSEKVLAAATDARSLDESSTGSSSPDLDLDEFSDPEAYLPPSRRQSGAFGPGAGDSYTSQSVDATTRIRIATYADRCSDLMSLAVRYTTAFVALPGVLFLGFPDLAISIFSDDPLLMELAPPLFRISYSGMLLEGIAACTSYAVVASGKAKVAAFLFVARQLIVQVPYLIFLRFSPWLTTDAVFAAFPLSDFSVGILSLAFYLFMQRRLAFVKQSAIKAVELV
jgi:Na+-driven multidrug efflux pump